MPNIPHDVSKGVHNIPFSKVVYIEQSDFKEVGIAVVEIIVYEWTDRRQIISIED